MNHFFVVHELTINKKNTTWNWHHNIISFCILPHVVIGRIIHLSFAFRIAWFTCLSMKLVATVLASIHFNSTFVCTSVVALFKSMCTAQLSNIWNFSRIGKKKLDDVNLRYGNGEIKQAVNTEAWRMAVTSISLLNGSRMIWYRYKIEACTEKQVYKSNKCKGKKHWF